MIYRRLGLFPSLLYISNNNINYLYNIDVKIKERRYNNMPKSKRVWRPLEPREPWRQTTVDLLNDITWELENDCDINKIKELMDDYRKSISRMYQLSNPEKWSNFIYDDGIEIGCGAHAPFTEEAADRMDIPYYLVPAIPKKAHIWTSYGEEIEYDDSIHNITIDPSNSRLELRCTQ
jgi:hypothetical protein